MLFAASKILAQLICMPKLKLIKRIFLVIANPVSSWLVIPGMYVDRYANCLTCTKSESSKLTNGPNTVWNIPGLSPLSPSWLWPCVLLRWELIWQLVWLWHMAVVAHHTLAHTSLLLGGSGLPKSFGNSFRELQHPRPADMREPGHWPSGVILDSDLLNDTMHHSTKFLVLIGVP